MILTVTPNAAVDKTYRVDGFTLDRVNRPGEVFTVAGGKGINVARVYQTLGGRAVATGFLGGIQGQIVSRAMTGEKIANECVEVSGETRLCIAVIDTQTDTQTEINEAGHVVTIKDAERLTRRVETLLTEHSFNFMALCGSLPPGAPPELYADLIGLARRANVRTVLDTSGDALKHGIAARPWLVKPNRAELEAYFSRPLENTTDTLAAGRELLRQGVEIVILSQGEDGAFLLTADSTWQAKPPPIDFVSAVASGDSFIAAFLYAWTHGEKPKDLENALRLATGAGAANAATLGAGLFPREMVYALAEQAEIRQI